MYCFLQEKEELVKDLNINLNSLCVMMSNQFCFCLRPACSFAEVVSFQPAFRISGLLLLVKTPC